MVALSWSEEYFDHVVTLFIKKWEDNNTAWVIENPGKPSTIIESLENFKSSWLDIKVRKWYRGAAEGHVINYNGLESLNAVLKNEVTKHKLFPFSDFLLKKIGIVGYWATSISTVRTTVLS